MDVGWCMGCSVGIHIYKVEMNENARGYCQGSKNTTRGVKKTSPLLHA